MSEPRCVNCNKYPFCEKMEDLNSKCSDWKSKIKELYLYNTDGYNFDFKEIK